MLYVTRRTVGARDEFALIVSTAGFAAVTVQLTVSVPAVAACWFPNFTVVLLATVPPPCWSRAGQSCPLQPAHP